MAEMGRTLHIRGFPDDMEVDRLEDKLQIHFLQDRNGGGEITSITVKAAERCAILTFEDSRVALSVLRHGPHILEVDGIKYELLLTYPWQESLHLDKIIIDASMTIDCKHLPLDEKIVNCLIEKFPGLHVDYVKHKRHCSLHGPYSQVHAAVAYLMESTEDLTCERKHGVQSYRASLEHQGEAGSADQPHGLHLNQGSCHLKAQTCEILQHTKPNKNHTNQLQVQTNSNEKTKDWIEAVNMEDLSLIMEADAFAYLQSNSEEYRHILQNHGVRVVDVTAEGVTTLYLADAKVKTESKAKKHLDQAYKELSQLYQKLEGTLRRAQIPKRVLGLHGGRPAAFKDLQSLLPKVLLSFDQTNVYIVGESTEVSLAKQILLLGTGHEQGRKLIAVNESSSSLSCYPTSELEKAETAGAYRSVAPKMSISHVEQKETAGEEYKLAARFKNSELGLLGYCPVQRGKARECQDLTTNVASNSRPTPHLRSPLGPASENSRPTSHLRSPLGPSIENNGTAVQVKACRVTGAKHKEDVLFQKSDSLAQYASKTNVSAANNVSGAYPIGSAYTTSAAVKATPSTSVNAAVGLDKPAKSILSASTAKSSLRRANSFSGKTIQKQEMEKTGLAERSSLATCPHVRQRSNSLCSAKSAEAPPNTVSREVTVPTIMWQYMKEAYHSHLTSLTSEVQMSESVTDKNVKVVLKGSESSNVEECHHELKKLVDAIASDFYVQTLVFSDLGVTEGSKIFKACCSNIQSQFSKIVLRSLKDTLYLIGPKSVCSQATEMFKELFASELLNSGPLVNSYICEESIDRGPAYASANQVKFHSTNQRRPNQFKANCRTPENNTTDRVKGYQMQSATPVVKEKLQMVGLSETVKNDRLLKKSSGVSGEQLETKENFQKSLPLTAQKKQKTTTATLKQTNFPIHNHPESCACGESGANVAQTSCGVFLCPYCLPLHAQCTQCCKVKAAKEPPQEIPVHPLRKEQRNTEERKQTQGIRGTMKTVELSLSLPGHDRYTTAKITYSIPDGIQGEGHPNPGSPFQGGEFEAFLPLSSKGEGLLQCLKKAFQQGLTFTVCQENKMGNKMAKIWWNRIPHKTKMNGGKSGNGYPDSTYLTDLSEALKACGIEVA